MKECCRAALRTEALRTGPTLRHVSPALARRVTPRTRRADTPLCSAVRLGILAEHSSYTQNVPMRALGVDYGRRNVGLAVSTMGLAPRPLRALQWQPNGALLDMANEVALAAKSAGCDGIVVGLPVTQRGSLHDFRSDSQQGRRCRNFAQNVATLVAPSGVPVYLVDERGTSIEADIAMTSRRSRKVPTGHRDSVAAALILASFFEQPEAAVLVTPTALG